MRTKLIIMAQLILSALLISAATTAALTDNSATQLKPSVSAPSVLTSLAAVRPSRMNSTQLTMLNGKNLQLQTGIANELAIADQRIHWTISQHGESVKTLRGNLQAVDLPEGLYTVQLAVGHYRSVKQVNIRHDQQIQLYFSAALAELRLSSNQAIDWLITDSSKRSYRINAKSQFNELLPAGSYTVRALWGGLALDKKLHIQAGQQLEASLNMPIAKVRLMATKDSQPLFKAVAWDVYRLTDGARKLVGQYYLHNRAISIPPGHYEAVARYQGNSGKRQFRVRENSTNNVILALN